jgi:hypothetical protein
MGILPLDDREDDKLEAWRPSDAGSLTSKRGSKALQSSCYPDVRCPQIAPVKKWG